MTNERELQSLNEFKQKCRIQGLKITPQRVAIYKELSKSRAHPSADMMYRAIREEFPNISFDTVNRTLLTFAEIGLVEVLEVQGGPRRYEPNLRPHHHFYCQKCGEIFDLFDAGFDTVRVPEDVKRRFEVRTSRIVLSGLCEKCRAEIKH
jgi:Fur family peroxide stress response transcriptional regulator